MMELLATDENAKKGVMVVGVMVEKECTKCSTSSLLNSILKR